MAFIEQSPPIQLRVAFPSAGTGLSQDSSWDPSSPVSMREVEVRHVSQWRGQCLFYDRKTTGLRMQDNTWSSSQFP